MAWFFGLIVYLAHYARIVIQSLAYKSNNCLNLHRSDVAIVHYLGEEIFHDWLRIFPFLTSHMQFTHILRSR